MELDLYRKDGSILISDRTHLKTTNGKATTEVSARFGYLTGFKQLNSSHIAVVDFLSSCIRMVNREDNSNRVLVGTCGTTGFVDGATAKFYGPRSIELDERNPGHLLVTDVFNHALRSVDVASGTASTVIRTGFNNPRGLAWYKRRLLVTNDHYISEVSWSANGAVSNKKLTTTTARGYRDGDFSTAQFYSLYEIQKVKDDLFLVADFNNKRIRLLDMIKKKVLPVCIGSTTNCTTSTDLSINPASLLTSNNAVYVGGYKVILKLTGKYLPVCLFVYTSFYLVLPGLHSISDNLYTI